MKIQSHGTRYIAIVCTSLLCLTACAEGTDKTLEQFAVDDGVSTDLDNSVTWALTDNCNDGVATSASFIEVMNGQRTGNAWPGGSRVYVVAGSERFNLSCDAGTTVCYGAEPSNRNGTYWGVGLDGGRPCEDCCIPCGSGSKATSLIC